MSRAYLAAWHSLPLSANLVADSVARSTRAGKQELALRDAECQPVSIAAVKREFSAGGVVVRDADGVLQLAAIRPAGKAAVWALPKGNIAEGERAEEAAAREIEEETGVRAELLAKLGHVRYTYSYGGERIFKIVTFFLFRYVSGELGRLKIEHAHEVAEVRWLPLAEAPTLLAYGGERDMVRTALETLGKQAERL